MSIKQERDGWESRGPTRLPARGEPYSVSSQTGHRGQLVQDIEHSGEFVTLFFLVIDTASKELAWVRAGHDAAIVYDPDSDTFEEIGGSGMALGVDEKYLFGEQRRTYPSMGRVILLGTDGVWEASDLQGNRFGKKPVYDAVRKHHHRSASEILDAIFCAQAALH